MLNKKTFDTSCSLTLMCKTQTRSSTFSSTFKTTYSARMGDGSIAKFYDEKTMTVALLKAVEMWQGGKLSVSPPEASEGEQCRRYLMSLGQEIGDMRHMEVNVALGRLIFNNIGNHFSKVSSHRHHLRVVFDLLNLGKVEFLYGTEIKELEERIRIHDLSKYGPSEALGYSIMFKDSESVRPLVGEDKIIWDKAVNSHYMNNSHHPEFSRPSTMKMTALTESLIDMLACRLERNLREHNTLTAADLFHIPKEYLHRFHSSDMVRIKNLMASWSQTIDNMARENYCQEFLPMDLSLFIDQEKLLKLKNWEKVNKYVLLPIIKL